MLCFAPRRPGLDTKCVLFHLEGNLNIFGCRTDGQVPGSVGVLLRNKDGRSGPFFFSLRPGGHAYSQSSLKWKHGWGRARMVPSFPIERDGSLHRKCAQKVSFQRIMSEWLSHIWSFCRGNKLDTSCSSLIAKFTVISCRLWNEPSRLERTVGGFRVWNRFRSVIL